MGQAGTRACGDVINGCSQWQVQRAGDEVIRPKQRHFTCSFASLSPFCGGQDSHVKGFGLKLSISNNAGFSRVAIWGICLKRP